MLFAVCLVVLLPCAFTSTMYDLNLVDGLQTQLDKNRSTEEVFSEFKKIFGKVYEDELEDQIRKKTFEANVHYIKEHNLMYARGEKSYSLAVNQFADLTHTEFLNQYTGFRRFKDSRNGTTFLPPAGVNIPSSVD